MAGLLKELMPQFACCVATIVLMVSGVTVVSAQSKGTPEKGNELFDEQCSSCHNSASVDRKVGPGLKLLFAKPKLESNGKPVTDANVLDKIEKGGNGMPAFKDTLTAAKVRPGESNWYDPCSDRRRPSRGLPRPRRDHPNRAWHDGCW
jgi:cytochrome c